MRHALLFTALVTGLLQVAVPRPRPEPGFGLARDRRALRRTARPDRKGVRRRGGSGPVARRRDSGSPQGQARLLRGGRLPGQAGRQEDAEGLDLPRLFDDQALDFARSHDAGRGRQDPAARPGLQVLAGFQGTECQRRDAERDHRTNHLRAGAGRTRTHGPGPAAPHIGRCLRLRHPQRAGQGGL